MGTCTRSSTACSNSAARCTPPSTTRTSTIPSKSLFNEATPQRSQSSGVVMFYAIGHFTRYRYSRPVWQSIMEVRMHPRTDDTQRCFTFQLSVNPRARIFGFVDHMGNQVHHFDLPAHHRELTVVADALVNLEPPDPLPPALPPEAWDELESLIEQGDHWPMLMPSPYARPCALLDQLTKELGIDEPCGRDPVTLVT